MLLNNQKIILYSLATFCLILLMSNPTFAQIDGLFEGVVSDLKRAIPSIKYIFGAAYFGQILWAGITIWARINNPQSGSVKSAILDAVVGLVVTVVINIAAAKALQ
jgi:hypothetical protein